MKQKLALASWVVAVILSVVALLGVDSYVNMIKSHYGKAEKNQTQSL